VEGVGALRNRWTITEAIQRERAASVILRRRGSPPAFGTPVTRTSSSPKFRGRAAFRNQCSAATAILPVDRPKAAGPPLMDLAESSARKPLCSKASALRPPREALLKCEIFGASGEP